MKFGGSDAIPVYLDALTGKVLAPNSVAEANHTRKKARERAKRQAAGEEQEKGDADTEQEETPDSLKGLHVTASGDSRAEKDRLT
eukprot:7601700-Karenia_brevis.AAC.1